MIDVQIAIPELDALVRRFAAGPAIVADEMERAMQAAVLDVEGEVVERTPVDTGRLRNAIVSEVRGQGPEIVGIVGVANVPYAVPVERGSRPHLIVPRRAKALRFRVGGRVVFSRWARHPGFRGAHMFRDGARASEPLVRARFAQALRRVNERLGGR